MKKRKLRGIIATSIAIVAGCGLVACGKSSSKNNTNPPTTETTKYSITYNVNGHGEAPQALSDVTALPATLPTLSADGYRFEGWYLDAAFTTKATAGATISANTTLYAKWTQDAPATPSTPETTKYSVTYNVNGHGEAPQALSDVTALPATLPTLNADGYKFEGWYLDAACTTKATAGATVSANTTLYAKWTEITQFDILKESSNLIISEDFNSQLETDKLNDWTGVWGTKGIYNHLNPQTGVTANNTTNYVKLGNGTAELIDTTNAGTQLFVDFGRVLRIGKVTGYVEVTTKEIGDSWTFLQFIGTSATKENAEVFALRTKDKVIKYRLDGGSEAIPLNSIASENKTYNIYFEFDLENNKISVTINGIAFLTDFETSIKELQGIRFVSSDKNSRTLVIDNLAVAFEPAELSTYQSKLNSMLDAKYASMNVETNYASSKDAIDAVLETAKNQISEVLTYRAADQAYQLAMEQLKSFLTDSELELKNTKDAAKQALATYKSEEDYTINADALQDAIAAGNLAIDNATTIEGVAQALQTAKSSMDLIKTDAQELESKKTEAKSQLDTYKNEEDYTINATALTTAINDGKTSIDNATSIAEVETVLQTAKSSIDQIKTDAVVLQEERAKAYLELTGINDYSVDFNEEEHVVADSGLYKVAEILAIDKNDSGKADIYEQIINVFTGVKERLNVETTLDGINSLLTSIKSDIDTLLVSTTLSLDDAKEAAINNLTTYYNANKDGCSIGFDPINPNDKLLLYINNSTTVAEVNEAYNECINLIDLSCYVMSALAQLNESYGAITTDNYPAEFVTLVESVKSGIEDSLNTVVEAEGSTSERFKYDVIASKEKIDAALELCLVKRTALLEVYNHGMNAISSIKGSSNAATNANDNILSILLSETLKTNTIDAASKDAVDAIVTDVKANIDTEITNLESTKFTITLVNSTTESIEVTYGTEPNLPKLTATDAVFIGWYKDPAFTNEYKLGEVYDDDTLYAKWHDALYKTSEVVNTYDYSALTALPADSDGIIDYTFNGETLNNGIITSNESKASRNIKITLEYTGKISATIFNTTKNVRTVFVDTTANDTNTSSSYGVTSVAKMASNFTFTSNVLNPGVYYLNWTGKGIGFASISVTQYETSITEYTEISEETSLKKDYVVGGELSLDGLSLKVKDGTPVALTDSTISSKVSYKIYNDSDDEVEQLSIAGSYKVVVTFGKYTTYTYVINVTE